MLRSRASLPRPSLFCCGRMARGAVPQQPARGEGARRATCWYAAAPALETIGREETCASTEGQAWHTAAGGNAERRGRQRCSQAVGRPWRSLPAKHPPHALLAAQHRLGAHRQLPKGRAARPCGPIRLHAGAALHMWARRCRATSCRRQPTCCTAALAATGWRARKQHHLGGGYESPPSAFTVEQSQTLMTPLQVR